MLNKDIITKINKKHFLNFILIFEINEILEFINKSVYIIIKYMIFNVNYRRVYKIFVNKIKEIDVINFKM